MLSFKNFFLHPLTTLGGALLGTLQAALGGAAAAFTQTGNVTDWKPYAAAGAAGAATFVVGGLLPDHAPVAAVPIDPATLAPVVPAPAPASLAATVAPLVAAASPQLSADVAQLLAGIVTKSLVSAS
jgi:hypothetical protein